MGTVNDFSIARRRMVEEQLRARGVSADLILKAFLEVPRHLFVDPAVAARAYDDCSLPIGFGQTISQPYIQAAMIDQAGVRSGDRVLEIGTGSGYQTAILSLIAREVCSVERIAALSRAAEGALKRIRTGRIRLKIGDGSSGWPFYAPFDRIIVSAAMRERPDVLIDQLADRGTLIVPLQRKHEQLVLFNKMAGRVEEQRLSRCAFVPLLKGVG
mgnify:CR=1 FL=1